MADRLIWLDGEIVSANRFHLDATDELVLYGRGVFQTTRTREGEPWLWDRHLHAMMEAATQAGVPIIAGDLPSASAAREFVSAVGQGDVSLRLNAGAVGPSGRARVWMFHRPLSLAPTGLRLRTSPFLGSRSDAMACVKSMNYLSRHLSYESAIHEGFHDSLILTSDKEVLETAHGNIFARIDGRWRTPPAGGGLLAGTVREWLLENAPLGMIVEKKLTFDDLIGAEGVAVTNSVRGVVPVERINDRTLSVERVQAELVPLLEKSYPPAPL